VEHPRAGIVTINWNGLNDTVACVTSLLALSYPAFHVVIVENGSQNDEASRLTERFAGDRRVTVIRNPRNDGYAEGNNVGIRNARSAGWDDCIWIVNNDATVDPAALDHLISAAHATPNVGVVSSTILYPDKRTAYALGGGTLNMWTGIDRLIGARQPWDRSRPPIRIDYVSGASFFISRAALDTLVGFDPDYFLYSEEADFCVRARRAGFALAYASRSVVIHQSAKSVGHLSATYVYYFLRNKYVLMRKQAHWYQWPTWFLTFSGYYGLGYIVLLVVRRRWSTLPIVARAIRDSIARRWGYQKIS
jgi:GT2 family glycosyltransferase